MQGANHRHGTGTDLRIYALFAVPLHQQQIYVELLGKGAEGVVYRVEINGIEYAGKRVRLEFLCGLLP
jgi:hypothetical protein